ncbi:MAG TPA: hypothetical protein VFA07_06020 [Chthonomonadaceae bacterium]|nr:hypothetical protein [Chthonomonadaceae bacterium]
MDTSRKTKRKNELLLGVVGCLALAAMFGWMGWVSLNRNPALAIPTPRMPSPNAYDYYVRASDAIKPITYHGSKVNVIFSILMKSGALEPSYPADEKGAFVNANAPALKLLREGFTYDCQLPPVRSFHTPHDLLNPMGDFARLARLLLIAGEIKASAGNWGGAMQSDLDAIQLGEDLSRGGGLGPFMEGDLYQRFGQQAAEAAVDHLTATQARETARRLERILARHAPFRDVLQEEKWQCQARLLELFRRPGWRGELIGGRNDEDIKQRAGRWKLYLVSKKQIMDGCTHYLDRWIAKAGQPYAAHVASPPLPDNDISKSFVFDYSRLWSRDVQIQARNVLLLLRLALRAYHLEHGRYPTALKDLIPSYLTRLPDDPLAMQGSFSYHRDGSTYTLFSGILTSPGSRPEILQYP